MLLNDALNQIIDDGIEAARQSYSKPRDKMKFNGSERGFGECRGRGPEQIQELLISANEECTRKHRDQAHDYWYWRCRAAEIEWVANVLSCIMVAQGWKPISIMTAFGGLKAAEIIGSKAA